MTIIPLPPVPVLALQVVVGLLALLGVGWLARAFGLTLPAPLERFLSGRLAPVIAGVLTSAIVLFVWRSVHEPGTSHDEQAYLLQAEILAGGHWTGEPPPFPEFFGQPHVLSEPRLAAKYPPGNSLALVPGIWLGWPGLMPVILSGVAGALIYSIVRQLTDASVALLTWALWSTSVTSLFWRATYYSQNPSAVLWLVALLGLLRWGGSQRPLFLAVTVFSFGAMYLARPLTAVTLGLPAAVLIAAMAWKMRLWRQVLLCAAIVVPILVVDLVWRERTTGSWRAHPYQEYTRQYLPFDRPGFGLDSTPPTRPLTPALTWINETFTSEHAGHQAAALPAILTARVIVLLRSLGEGWRVVLVALAIVGLVHLRGAGWFGVISSAVLLLGYLAYAHGAWWNVYYAEVFPVFFFVAAIGSMWFVRMTAKLNEAGMRAAAAIVVLITTPLLAMDVLHARQKSDERSEFQRRARQVLATVHEPRAVVFVSYGPDHAFFQSPVVNTPDYRTAPMWLVYDRGVDNERLLRTTDRPAYRLRTQEWTLERIR